MRPVQLTVQGVASYKEKQCIDFTLGDYFAIVGPIGAGKSAIMDALTYAFYGRISKETGDTLGSFLNVSSKLGIVTLDFTVKNQPFSIEKRLEREKDGSVRTKAAILTCYDTHGTQIRQVSGVKDVETEVQEILGLTFNEFNTAIVLPQGKFAELLNASFGKRKSLLMSLLSVQIYETIASQARKNKRAQETQKTWLENKLGELGEYSSKIIKDAKDGLKKIADDSHEIETLQREISDMLQEGRLWLTGQQTLIDTLSTCNSLPAVPQSLLEGDRLNTQLATQMKEQEARLQAVKEEIEQLENKKSLQQSREKLIDMLNQHAVYEKTKKQVHELKNKQDALEKEKLVHLAEERKTKETYDTITAQLEEAKQTNLATAIASNLQDGDTCPVCSNTYSSKAHREESNLADSQEQLVQNVTQLTKKQTQALHASQRAAASVVATTTNVTNVQEMYEQVRLQLEKQEASLRDVPSAKTLQDSLTAWQSLEERLQKAHTQERATGNAITTLRNKREALQQELQSHFSTYQTLREDLSARQLVYLQPADINPSHDDLGRLSSDAGSDGKASETSLDSKSNEVSEEGKGSGGNSAGKALGQSLLLDTEISPQREFELSQSHIPAYQRLQLTPDTSTMSLKEQWERLRTETAQIATEQKAVQAQVEKHIAQIKASGTAKRQTLDMLLRPYGLTSHDDGKKTKAGIAKHSKIFEQQIQQQQHIRTERDMLQTELKTMQANIDVSAELARLLDAKMFQQWIIEQASKLLIAEAGTNLLQLSQGQFSLALDAETIMVIDETNANKQRKVGTLSGGETFLASLALALALARQISAPQGAMLESLFIDEGFGSLDVETLDVVANALETLGADDKMVGIITHVPELADRIPLRYEVEKKPTGSVITVVEAD